MAPPCLRKKNMQRPRHKRIGMAVPQFCRMCLVSFYFFTWCGNDLNTNVMTGMTARIAGIEKKTSEMVPDRPFSWSDVDLSEENDVLHHTSRTH